MVFDIWFMDEFTVFCCEGGRHNRNMLTIKTNFNYPDGTGDDAGVINVPRRMC